MELKEGQSGWHIQYSSWARHSEGPGGGTADREERESWIIERVGSPVGQKDRYLGQAGDTGTPSWNRSQS